MAKLSLGILALALATAAGSAALHDNVQLWAPFFANLLLNLAAELLGLAAALWVAWRIATTRMGIVGRRLTQLAQQLREDSLIM